eukprot:m.328566 g.328566  ORF g.328566 m.328566 type:complete len:151 (-) comp20433_c0_seq2:1919-2371(-)
MSSPFQLLAGLENKVVDMCECVPTVECFFKTTWYSIVSGGLSVSLSGPESYFVTTHTSGSSCFLTLSILFSKPIQKIRRQPLIKHQTSISKGRANKFSCIFSALCRGVQRNVGCYPDSSHLIACVLHLLGKYDTPISKYVSLVREVQPFA